jgi:hypothetical protein
MRIYGWLDTRSASYCKAYGIELTFPAWRIARRTYRSIIRRSGGDYRGTRRQTSSIQTALTPPTRNASGENGYHTYLSHGRSHTDGSMYRWISRLLLRWLRESPFRQQSGIQLIKPGFGKQMPHGPNNIIRYCNRQRLVT